jgi:two-component system sensor histidine kinase TorS
LALFGDVVKIRQILGNLISNAVKYTKRGTITLSVDHATDDSTGQVVLSFCVLDTGVGMSQDTIAQAFDAYSRTSTALRAGIEGIGLGLAISRQLTEALGGALSVESEPGVGSRFTLTVPLARGDLALIAQDEADLNAGDFARNVLVIDDHAVNRMVARGYLERMGCRVAQAETGNAGLRAAESQQFDLILIDLDLPDMQGAEVAAQISAKLDAPMLVALTAHLISDTDENRTRLHVARILAKPISPRALAEVLAASLPANVPTDASELHDSLAEDIKDIGLETTALIVQEFLRDLPSAVQEILTPSGLAPSGNGFSWNGQRKAAHRLKGAASNFRLDRFCAALAQVEAAEIADEALLKQVQSLADEAAKMLTATANQLGLQTDRGSTK